MVSVRVRFRLSVRVIVRVRFGLRVRFSVTVMLRLRVRVRVSIKRICTNFMKCFCVKLTYVSLK